MGLLRSCEQALRAGWLFRRHRPLNRPDLTLLYNAPQHHENPWEPRHLHIHIEGTILEILVQMRRAEVQNEVGTNVLCEVLKFRTIPKVFSSGHHLLLGRKLVQHSCHMCRHELPAKGSENHQGELNRDDNCDRNLICGGPHKSERAKGAEKALYGETVVQQAVFGESVFLFGPLEYLKTLE